MKTTVADRESMRDKPRLDVTQDLLDDIDELMGMVSGLLFMKFGHWPLWASDQSGLGSDWIALMPELEKQKEAEMHKSFMARTALQESPDEV